ncbi:tRNA pseudouridine(13) synthase TruD [Engelhardtia mirabilis]|uniref:tRNA pseudouridine synthase D n=1 Tax=Engelhardtia mirabilis TaxID=2528011 RepID=A0A518BQ64_9BACT|nr:tRNA pseudouridine synthase D [Planctomycetes bacterium Pla133]QDV03452.1 tRNA pseudouridine synthase D [Planctomycetes bacterium Pla86]
MEPHPHPELAPSLPRLLPADRAVAMVARRVHEDFQVEERPLEAPSGSGDFLWVRVEKRGLTTTQAVADLARRCGVPPRQVRHAGLKDARAVTRQWLSVEGVRREPSEGALSDRARILEVTRHRRPLDRGDLAGNAFRLKLREVPAGGAARLREGLEELARRGLPAAFGLQRFGARGDTGAIGLAVLREDWARAAALIAGTPGEHDSGPVREARELFEARSFAAAQEAFPRGYETSAQLARAMATNRGRPKNALRSLGAEALSFYVAAAQSLVFNRVLAARLPELEQLLPGDELEPIDGGRRFAIDDPTQHQAASDAAELTATGPLPGPRGKLAQGQAGELERAALAELGTTPELFDAAGRFRQRGARRPLRMRLREPEVNEGDDESGAFAELCFVLPAGGYATGVLDELGQDQLQLVERD